MVGRYQAFNGDEARPKDFASLDIEARASDIESRYELRQRQTRIVDLFALYSLLFTLYSLSLFWLGRR